MNTQNMVDKSYQDVLDELADLFQWRRTYMNGSLDQLVSVLPATPATTTPRAITRPVISQAFDNVGSSQGALAADAHTDDATPTMRISLPVGSAAVAVGDKVQLHDGGTRLVASLKITSVHLKNGYIDVAPPIDMGEGRHVFTARITNAAGVAGDVSDAFGLTIDTVRPLTPKLGLAKDTGSSGSDGITREASIQVQVESGASWKYTIDDTGVWTTGVGTSFNASPGAHRYRIQQSDAAGNTSDISAPLSVTLDRDISTAQLKFWNWRKTGETVWGELDSPTVQVSNVDAGVTWQYSTDRGTTWTNGSGNSFKIPGSNMVRNGKFDDGYAGFSTNYDVNGNWAGAIKVMHNYIGSNDREHFTGEGGLWGSYQGHNNFLFVDAANRGGFWHQTHWLTQGHVYEFSYYRRTTEHSLYWSKPALEMIVNWAGTSAWNWQTLGATDWLDNWTDAAWWTRVTRVFTAPSTGYTNFGLKDTNTSWQGNDFAIDSIALYDRTYTASQIQVRQTDVAGNTSTTYAPLVDGRGTRMSDLWLPADVPSGAVLA
jgi:hypothetical protein